MNTREFSAVMALTLAAACLTDRAAFLAAEQPAAGKPLLAHWTFDEESGDNCRDVSGNGCDAFAPPGQGAGIQRVRGIFGNALAFSGSHMLHIPGKPAFANLARISFSAWTMPTELNAYREIFRKEDGDKRVLFSYQDNGTHLSLGLNINGYVECDAPIEPRQVLDGAWHHCAATFDGEFMRVFLDGKEIGSLKRPGPIATGGAAPGCIGSLNGGECFQGLMDDLRIYADALSADEIAVLYRQGNDVIVRQLTAQDELARTLYAPAKSFAETFMDCARKVAERNAPVRRETAEVVQRRLKTDFPQDYDTFVRVTGKQAGQYQMAVDRAFAEKEAARIVGMLSEYKPLTERQWSSQTPEQAQSWKETEACEKRFRDLKALGDAARFSPEWVQLVLDAGPRVRLRPYVNEAVAPYVTPSTPETRDRTAAEARAALERDWLHQADNNPTPDRIRKEILWTRQLAARLTTSFSDKVDLAKETAELEQLETRAAKVAGADPRLYVAVRELKRRIMFRNPVVDFDSVLFVDMPYPQGSEWNHETRHRLGYMAVPGARLLVLRGLSPEGTLKQLMPQPPFHGSFWRPDVSYDAKKVLFCFKPHNEKTFHLYEIGVDGSGLVQLTDGPYDDLDPIYLPDGQNILFSTTRGHTYVRCMPPTNAFVLARCGLDGKGIYLLSANNEPDYLPSMMDDGRVVYTRWEYTDKPLWRAQKLWTIHPDGTQVNMLWGNQSVWPDVLKDARNIPGTRRVLFTGSAHHNWFAGSVGIVDPDRGLNFPHGLTKITADVVWPECGNGPVDPVESPRYHASGRYEAYYSPYPLGEQDFIVSANRGGKFVLYLMDVDGNRELIYEGVHHIFDAMPLKPRLKPPVVPDAVEWPGEKDRLKPKDGVIYSANVYQGAPEELRGKAKFLRVLSIDHKTYTYWHKRPYLSTGPVVSGVQSEGVKRFIGTVPIGDDGSVAFYAPAGIPLHFQLLDGSQRALHTMRSFANVMPGEHRGCLGCHELHSVTSEARARTYAVRAEPLRITPPPWGEDTVSYARYVRPVLDKYCGKCHQGDGAGRKTFDMTPRPGFLGFDETYWTFIGRPTWGQPYAQPKNPPPGWGIADMIMVEAYHTTDPAGYQTPKPMTQLSYKSRLVERASSGKHHDVKVDAESLLRLIVWVDTMCPYQGDEEIRAMPDPDFQGVDWLAIRPRIKNAPHIVRPGPVDAAGR
ncbi:MAG: hypothetical protein NTW87_22615 [Planctomycetota bacterium]|nr:hypothetical protein [Planctomycetota bacterium]